MRKTQMLVRFRTRRRPKRGRPPKKDSGVSHLQREEFSRHHPVHVTLRAAAGVGFLRRQRVVSAVEEAFRQARIRFGMRIVHYSIQGNHLHLLVEAEDREALGKGMQGLAIRIAKTLNRLFNHGGRVWADRYYAHVLRTRREVANALRYVLGNFARHARQRGERVAKFVDAFSSIRFLGFVGSDAPVAAPRTWLLGVGWRGTELQSSAV
ncbi:MAG: transposase [Myxococcales bacterium]|nr:transposase [Myxococcales bacterium]